MAQNYFYPPSGSGGSGSNASVSANGAAIPTSSTLVAGKGPTGLQTPVSVDSSGDINVNIVGGSGAGTVTVVQPTGSNLHADIDSSALPTGASTSALQTTGNTSLASIDTKTPTLGQKTISNSVPVAIASDQTSIPVTVGNFPGTQPVSGTVFVSSIGAGANAIGAVSVSNFPATQPVNGTVAVVQPTASNLNATVTGTVTVVQPTATNLNVEVGNFPTTQAVSGTVTSLAGTPTALTIHNAALTVGLTAQRLTVGGTAPVSTRVVMVATPDSAATGKFYIGSSGVTSSGPTRGIQILAGQVFIANNDAGDYYIISDTASQTVEIMEQY